MWTLQRPARTHQNRSASSNRPPQPNFQRFANAPVLSARTLERPGHVVPTLERGNDEKFHIFIEGGGQGRLRNEARQGFGQFFGKTALGTRKPKITACGTRHHAYEDFCEALKHVKEGDLFLLLVDSEAPFSAIDGTGSQTGFWSHVATRPGDGWTQPAAANEGYVAFHG